MREKTLVLSLLIAAEVLAMGLWFVSAAIIGEMRAEALLSDGAAAALSAAVQVGFVCGALVVAISGVADRFHPPHLLAASAALGAAANALLIWAPIGGALAIGLRALTGAALAGVYPVGMKIATGWGQRDRGLIVGLLVGGLTLGSAAPHGLSLLGGANWRLTVIAASALALLGAGLALCTRTGPFHARAPAFDPAALRLAWRDHAIRRAYGGYLGHMWELYVVWAWLVVALQWGFAQQLPAADAAALAKAVTFAAVGVGAISCALAGLLADRLGKAEVAIGALLLSGGCALAFGAALGGPPWLVVTLALLWGAAVIADSAQFSALVADHAPAQAAGTLMAFQNALGFALTVLAVQAAPWLAAQIGWPLVMASLALGPVFGVWSMWGLRRGALQ